MDLSISLRYTIGGFIRDWVESVDYLEEIGIVQGGKTLDC